MGPEQDSCEDGFLEDGLSGPRCAAINPRGPLLLVQAVVVLPPLLPPARLSQWRYTHTFFWTSRSGHGTHTRVDLARTHASDATR